MRVVLHVCCGPCAIYPVDLLRQEGMTISGFFHNPNIHPFREFQQRIVALEEFAGQVDLPLVLDREYGLRAFLREIVFHEDDRCGRCYAMRLAATARHAVSVGADAFSSTLLYSRYQKHEDIRRLGEALAAQHGIAFYYRDFRQGWQEGIDRSRAMGLYRQPYCGCIYSEEERYDKRWRRRPARR